MATSATSATSPSSDSYFGGYEDLEVHELMLKDKPRTRAYQKYIEDNKAVFEDKVVVDVGAGTGILSLFAARAGAKHVYAIEASGIANLCREIITENDLSERITVINCRVEDAELPGGAKADILISEWMGFYLLHESMLHSLLNTRDRLLKPDGLIAPSSASIYLCPVSMHHFQNDKFQFWKNVYGFDFSPALTYIKRKNLSEPQILTLDPDQCLADPELVTCLELRYVEPEDIEKVVGSFNFKMTRNGVFHGFACWFDVDFEGDPSSTLSTGPSAPETHWKQTCIILPDALMVSKEEQVKCHLILTRSQTHPRRYDICIEVEEDMSEGGSEDEDLVDEEGYLENAEDLIKSAIRKT